MIWKMVTLVQEQNLYMFYLFLPNTDYINQSRQLYFACVEQALALAEYVYCFHVHAKHKCSYNTQQCFLSDSFTYINRLEGRKFFQVLLLFAVLSAELSYSLCVLLIHLFF